MSRAVTAHGFDPRFTPIDVLMAGPVAMHLDEAEDMASYDDADPSPDGFNEWDPEAEEAENARFASMIPLNEHGQARYPVVPFNEPMLIIGLG